MIEEKFENIKELRKYKRLTQIEMSKLLNMSLRNYRSKENGKLPFNQLEMIKIIRVFNLNYEETFHLFFINCL